MFATAVSMPDVPVPETANANEPSGARNSRVNFARTSSSIATMRGSRWPTVGAAIARITRGDVMDGPGPSRMRSDSGRRLFISAVFYVVGRRVVLVVVVQAFRPAVVVVVQAFRLAAYRLDSAWPLLKPCRDHQASASSRRFSLCWLPAIFPDDVHRFSASPVHQCVTGVPHRRATDAQRRAF